MDLSKTFIGTTGAEFLGLLAIGVILLCLYAKFKIYQLDKTPKKSRINK